MLAEFGLNVAIIGTKSEAQAAEEIRHVWPATVSLLNKTSIFDIAVLARNAVGAVGNDTGPTHIAALSGCPTVALFSGATDPVLSAPKGKAVRIVRAEHLPNLSVREVIDDVIRHLSLHEPKGLASRNDTQAMAQCP
jgi:ADP-heptose:LPS heptosyltransferase